MSIVAWVEVRVEIQGYDRLQLRAQFRRLGARKVRSGQGWISGSGSDDLCLWVGESGPDLVTALGAHGGKFLGVA